MSYSARTRSLLDDSNGAQTAWDHAQALGDLWNSVGLYGSVDSTVHATAPSPASSSPADTEGTVATFSYSGNPYIDGLLYGASPVRWTGTVSYNYPNTFSAYGSYSHTITAYEQIPFEMRTAVRSILGQPSAAVDTNFFAYGSVASFTNLNFLDVNTQGGSADIMIAMADFFDGANLATARVADFPRTDQRSDGGDVWFGNDYNGTINDFHNPIIGNYAWVTTIHELGHALGLSHAHNAGGGIAAVPADRDAMEYTVMSYRSYLNGPTTGYTNEQFGYAQTFMMLDIQALQYLYGADYGVNNTSSTYTWSPTTGQMFINGVGQGTPGANRVFLTIWDGGGTDTYDLSNYSTNLNINLAPGAFSLFSATQRANLGNGNFAQGNVYNSLLNNNNAASLIENAVGGTGDDTFRGNVANNLINGGLGADTFIFDGNRSVFAIAENSTNYVVTGNGQGTDTLVSIESFQFNDFTVSDDYRAGVTSSTPTINVGTGGGSGTATGSLTFMGDRDWFGAQTVGGQWYTINLLGSPTGDGTLSDSYLRVHDSAGTLLAQNDDAGEGFNSRLIVGFSNSDVRYLSAGAFSDGRVGTYRMSIEQTVFHDRGSFTGAGAGSQGWYVGDYNADGRSDLLRYVNGVGSQVLTNNGSGGFDAPATWSGAGNLGLWNTGDFNGDGRTDIFRYNPGVSGAEVQLSTGTTFGALSSWTGGGSGAQGWYVGDFNGDGRDDIMRYNTGVSGAEVLLSNGSSFDVAQNWSGAGNNGRWYTGDFNGDGRDDIMRFTPGSSGAQVMLSNGSTFGSPTTWLSADYAGSDGWYIADFNQDGRSDIMRYLPGVSGAQVFVATASGSFVNAGSWSGAGHGDDHWYLGNFAGQSGVDLLRVVVGSTGGQVFEI